jgi:hypothetical protein
MIVKLKNNWFAPQGEHIPDSIRKFSGQLFKNGEQLLPDALFDFLPKSAKVIEEPALKQIEKDIPVPVVPEPSLKDFDNSRPASEAEMNINNEVHERLAKAREAKKLKQAAKVKA